MPRKGWVEYEDLRDCQGGRINRTVVTAIECISAEDRILEAMGRRPVNDSRE